MGTQVLQVSGGSLAVETYRWSESSPFVYASGNRDLTSGPPPLLVIADLVDAVPGAVAIARDVVHGVASYLQYADRDDPRDALRHCFRTANERVIEENRSRSGMRRLHLGLTAVVALNDGLFIAQCAPSQVLIWKGGKLLEHPKLSTWSARDITGTFASFSYPLGFQSDVTPRVSRHACAPGDGVAVVSWQLARRLHDSGTLLEESGPNHLNMILEREIAEGGGGHLHGAMHWFRETRNEAPLVLSHPQKIGASNDESHAVFGGRSTPQFDRLEAETAFESVTEELPNLRSQLLANDNGDNHVGISSKTERFTRPDQTAPLSTTHGPEFSQPPQGGVGVSGGADDVATRRGNPVEILAGLLLSLSAAVVGVWQISKRDRPIHGPRDDGTLGLPHLQRWSDSYHAPRFESVRRVSPRLQVNRFLAAGALMALAGVAAFLTWNTVNRPAEVALPDFEARLSEVAIIRSQVDPALVTDLNYNALLSAQAMLADLEAQAPNDEMMSQVRAEQGAVAQSLATLTSTTVINNVQVLGALPPQPDDVTPRLFSGAGRVFALSGALYELDQANGVLVLLLSAGDVVGGSPIGPLLAATWNEDRLVAIDSLNAFVQNPADGEWHRIPLGVITQGGFSDVTSVRAFDRNLYFLSAEMGMIYKYDSLDFGASPENWALASTSDVLSSSVDFHIDGSIHVLMDDGRVVTFFRSAVDHSFKPAVLPAQMKATAIVPVAGGSYFYILDSAGGRIVAVSSDGVLYRQFLALDGLPSFHGATGLVINEGSGLSYLLVNNTLMAIRLTVPIE